MSGVLVWLLAPAAWSAPAGFELLEEVDGCRLYLGPTEAEGVVPMRAECHWQGVDGAAIADIVAHPDGHEEVWSQIAETRVWSGEADAQRLWFLHDLPGFSDREVVVDWRREDLAGGGVHTSWTTADVDFEAAPGHTRARLFEGEWTVRPLEGGVVQVLHETRYDPGAFPGWLVRPFLGGTLEGVMDDLRQSALATAESP